MPPRTELRREFINLIYNPIKYISNLVGLFFYHFRFDMWNKNFAHNTILPFMLY